MFTWGLILLVSLAWLGEAQPIESGAEQQQRWIARDKRSPAAAATMIYIRGQPTNSGYQYERPARAFNPVGAYATGGSAASGSFYGSPSKKQVCGPCKELVDEQPDLAQPNEEKQVPVAPEEEPKPVQQEIPAEYLPAPAPESKPKAEKAPKSPKTPKPRPSDDDDDDDDDDAAPRKGSRNGGSVYKNFFPMMFAGSSSGARDATGGDRGQGGATAIANSFSKGRGAVASSSATAYGSPDASQSRQSQPSRYRTRA